MRILKPFQDHFWDFYNPFSPRVKEKIDNVLQIVISIERIPSKFFKHADDGIYEIRIEFQGNIYRIFSFFEMHNHLIVLHGFKKKSQKIPAKEIRKAKTLRGLYYESKNNKRTFR